MAVTVLGGTTLDLLAAGLPRLPAADEAGDEFTDRSLVHLPTAPVVTIGGNGGNAAYALARLGCPVHLVTSLGRDPLGQAALGWLEAAGCQVTLLPPELTSVNVSATDTAARRACFFFPVATDREAALACLDGFRFQPGDHLLVTGYPHPEEEVTAAWAARARQAGATVSLDVGPAVAGFTLDRLEPLLDLLDLLFCNERELAVLAAGQDGEALAERLATALGEGLVVKRGAAGATFHGRAGRAHVPAFRVPATVTVGAGDTFNAGVVFASLARPAPPRERLRFGAATAALMLQAGRGVLGAPTSAEVEAFLARHPRP